jgi:murein DD-endopeptidase MepM/ murein hydrolase activator NlpD
MPYPLDEQATGLQELIQRMRERSQPDSDVQSRLLLLKSLLGGGGLTSGGMGMLGGLGSTVGQAGADYAGRILDTGGGNPFRVLPVEGLGLEDFSNDWLAQRVGHLHQGNDLFAPAGTPVYAPFGGELDYQTGGLGGLSYKVSNPNKGYVYGAHLQGFAPDLTEGERIRRGELLGYVGNTGNARGTSPHLHFEYHPQGGSAVNPFTFLEDLIRRTGGGPSGGPTRSPTPSTSGANRTRRRPRPVARSRQQR